jgi:tetratricopeptide (TPR) repeat protein
LNPWTLEPSNPDLPAAAAAALFAVHPGYSEAILWASNIAGLGVAACTLAVLLIHVSPLAQRWSAQLVVALLFLVGLWFKEAGILMPALMALYDVLLAPDRGWRRLLRVWPRYAILIPPFALYYGLRLHALGGALPGFESVPLSRFELVINAVALVPQYVATFCWPVDLNMYHDFDAIHSVWSWRFAGGLAVIALGALAIIACWRRRAVISFAVAWMFVTVSPHLLARWPQLNVYAERYLYLPAVGAFLIVAYVAPRWPVRSYGRALAWGAAALLLLAVAIDVRRAGDWHDEVTLYSKTLTQSRRAELIRINLGLRLYQLGRYDEGIAVLRELVAFDPSWHDAWHNLGLLYLAQHLDDDAVVAFENALQRDPSNAETLLNLGYLYDRAGRRDDALSAYFRALRLQPDNDKVWYNLANIAIAMQQRGNAREAVDAILGRTPDDRDAQALARQLASNSSSIPPPSGETERRCAMAKRAVDEGRYADAIVALRVASWYDEASPLPHQYLANVYYLIGRLPQAVEEQRQALVRAPGNVLYQRNLASLEKALGTQ